MPRFEVGRDFCVCGVLFHFPLCESFRQIFGGYLATRYGGGLVLFVAVLLPSICTAATPPVCGMASPSLKFLEFWLVYLYFCLFCIPGCIVNASFVALLCVLSLSPPQATWPRSLPCALPRARLKRSPTLVPMPWYRTATQTHSPQRHKH